MAFKIMTHNILTLIDILHDMKKTSSGQNMSLNAASWSRSLANFDYSCLACWMHIQWNPSDTYTIGPLKCVQIRGLSSFQGVNNTYLYEVGTWSDGCPLREEASLSVKSDNAQLLHTMLALERELTSHLVCAIWTIPIFHWRLIR